MLGRLITGAGIMRAGYGMMRKGADLKSAKSAAAQARTKAIIDSVRTKTRGYDHKKTAAMFSRHTNAGRNRRNQAAALIRAKRAGLPSGQTHASYAASLQAKNAAASRTRSAQIVRNVKGVTRSIVPAHWLNKKSASGKINRTALAGFLKDARRAPTRGYGNRANETFHFQKPRKYQGPKI